MTCGTPKIEETYGNSGAARNGNCWKSNQARLPIVLVLWSFLLSTAILTGCTSNESEAPYKVIDSGIWANDHSAPRGATWWLDKDRVIFPADETLGVGGKVKKITIWNTATGRLTFSHRWDLVFCVSTGNVFYGIRSDFTQWSWPHQLSYTSNEAASKPKYFRGTLENAQEYPYPAMICQLMTVTTAAGCLGLLRVQTRSNFPQSFSCGETIIL